jgi:hypothetical protein
VRWVIIVFSIGLTFGASTVGVLNGGSGRLISGHVVGGVYLHRGMQLHRLLDPNKPIKKSGVSCK